MLYCISNSSAGTIHMLQNLIYQVLQSTLDDLYTVHTPLHPARESRRMLKFEIGWCTNLIRAGSSLSCMWFINLSTISGFKPDFAMWSLSHSSASWVISIFHKTSFITDILILSFCFLFPNSETWWGLLICKGGRVRVSIFGRNSATKLRRCPGLAGWRNLVSRCGLLNESS